VSAFETGDAPAPTVFRTMGVPSPGKKAELENKMWLSQVGKDDLQ